MQYLAAPTAASNSTSDRAAAGPRHGKGTYAGASASGAAGSGGSPVLTVRVGDRAFVVHRGLLAERCGYFKQLLESEGFAESGADEVTLGEADPEVFGRLLCFIYWDLLAVPEAQLRMTLELAGRLLVPEVCEQLKPRVLTACTPATIISDMLWADAHNLAALIPDLKNYFIHNLKAVAAAAPEQLDDLTSRSPALAAEIFRTMARSAQRG
ncbi:hypothetical protein GPECTOR_20g519 [Gonium pectorale]|uniref:BTB domain-containing protein n=1 Tax=Gonium pectorale TaxID=33097 RepID=A0A150GIM1_GONPE|nr:hypothetical protein GPECTOR_20g519 [Gonium pectorale]|eukprot:KXZ49662.1 hypothetical protein GPECTOR_20g519 [Gonium pectorale]